MKCEFHVLVKIKKNNFRIKSMRMLISGLPSACLITVPYV